jgi:hypothetical protein
MSLERKLAEIEVLTDEIEQRVKANKNSQTYLTNIDFLRSLSGIKSDSKTLMQKYTAFNKSYEDFERSRYIAEFALDAKNLADNLNIFLQVLYGTYKGNLKDIEKNTREAPKLDTGETVFERHRRAHNYLPTSPLVQIRNMKGHGQGHYIINGSQKAIEGSESEWINSQAEAYLGMARDILKTISDKETAKLAPKKSVKTKSLRKRMWENWKERHRKTLTALTAGTLITGSVLGTLFVNNLSEKNKTIDEAYEILNVVYAIQLESQENLALSNRHGEESFEKAIGRIKQETENIEILPEQALNILRAYSRTSETLTRLPSYPDTTEYHRFFKRLKGLREELDTIKYSPTIETVNKLAGLLQTEKYLKKFYRDVGWTYLRYEPASSSEGIYRWVPKTSLEDFTKVKLDSTKTNKQ